MDCLTLKLRPSFFKDLWTSQLLPKIGDYMPQVQVKHTGACLLKAVTHHWTTQCFWSDGLKQNGSSKTNGAPTGEWMDTFTSQCPTVRTAVSVTKSTLWTTSCPKPASSNHSASQPPQSQLPLPSNWPQPTLKSSPRSLSPWTVPFQTAKHVTSTLQPASYARKVTNSIQTQSFAKQQRLTIVLNSQSGLDFINVLSVKRDTLFRMVHVLLQV